MSRNIVIVNFNKLGDVFQSAHLMSSIKQKSPMTCIHYLCFEESLPAAKILKDIDHLHSIPRKKIVSFIKNPIYSDGLAFDSLSDSLSNIRLNKNDKIINYSNDHFGTNICSYLSLKSGAQVDGIKFDQANILEYSNNQSILINDILPSYTPTPYNLNNAYHALTQTPYTKARDAVYIDTKNQQVAKSSIDKLRATRNTDETKVIGIQVSSALEEKDIPFETVTSFISLCISETNYIPLLLVAPTKKEKDKADEINALFGDTLVSVESDFKALPSVLTNIDLLVTPDTSVKHLADLLSTKVVEVSLGPAPVLKQGSNQMGSLILTLEPSVRIFKQDDHTKPLVIEENKILRGSDIFHTCVALMNNQTNAVELSEGVICYKPIMAGDGLYHIPIKGNINTTFELRRLVGRTLVQKIIYNTIDKSLLAKVLTVFDKKDVHEFINNEKKELAETTKDLLSTLRELVRLQESKTSNVGFIKALERLFMRCHQSDLSSIGVLIFRAKVETIKSSSLEQNLKEVESLIYQLKNNIQSSLYTLSECGKIVTESIDNKQRLKEA